MAKALATTRRDYEELLELRIRERNMQIDALIHTAIVLSRGLAEVRVLRRFVQEKRGD